jgi:bifunctional DNA-binding transcriptional regulator/antitoxin component of YhaV-PrlF toxin-antitoxin module
MQVTIPRPLAVEMEFAIGDRVQIYQVGRVLCVRRFDEGGFTPEVVAVRPGPVGERFG